MLARLRDKLQVPRRYRAAVIPREVLIHKHGGPWTLEDLEAMKEARFWAQVIGNEGFGSLVAGLVEVPESPDKPCRARLPRVHIAPCCGLRGAIDFPSPVPHRIVVTFEFICDTIWGLRTLEQLDWFERLVYRLRPSVRRAWEDARA